MRFIALVSGILLILLALLARRIGIDHDAAWGPSRYLLLVTGLALSGASFVLHLVKTGRVPESARRRFSQCARATGKCIAQLRQNTRFSVIVTALLLLGLALYTVWFTSFGLFPTFTRVVNPYVDLGEAFLQGQVALLAEPDPRLVALQNPYDFALREEVPYRWDLSYYKGKYYAYWGPAPALLYAAVQAITRTPPPDQLGVLVFNIGLGGVLALVLFRARQRFFPRAPGLSIPLFVMVALVNLPVMHILERCQVYETSVIAGQFFLLLGLLVWLHALTAQKPAWLFLAGLSWGLAIATRYNLALSVSVLLAYGLYRLWRTAEWTAQFWKQAAALLAPLGLCALVMALYNYSRFGNPLETGLAYQLTVAIYQNRHFSTTYFLSGLYMYLFYPLNVSQTFPFFPSIPVDFTRLPGWAALPPGRLFDEVFFGLVPSLPAFWLLVVLAPVSFVRAATTLIHRIPSGQTADRPSNPPASQQYDPRRQLAGVFGLAGLAQFAFLLFYYFGANRFLVDFLFLWLLALIFLAWEMDEILRPVAALRALFWLAALLLGLASAGIAVLAGFDIVPQFFRLYNPTIYGAISSYGNRVYTALLALPESPGLFGALLRFLLRLGP